MSNESAPELESVDKESIDENIEIESEIESSIQDDDDLSTTGGELPIVDELEDDIYDDSDIDSVFEDNSLDRLGNLLSSVLVNEEGETVCSSLVNISRQLEIQNKIMIKLLSHLQKQV
tara:strand:+ start:113 stop:466 length:354 start_codon:yes stop_codon:yes gene_type:complete